VSDTSVPVEAYAQIKVPKGFVPKDARARRELLSALAEAVDSVPHDQRRRRNAAPEDEEIARLRAAMRQHPCHGCADREVHARWAERFHRTDRQVRDLERRVAGRTNSIARRFDRVCEVLTRLGYLDDGSHVTPAGELLMRLYTESDLLAAQAILDGLWTGLTPQELAAVCAAVVYESRRSDEDETPYLPTKVVRESVHALMALWSDLRLVEAEHGIDATRMPDAGLVDATYRWANGESLLTILTRTDITAGDFVRWMRQLIDLLGQIAQTAGEPVASTARAAADLVNRGVVAYSSA
jgi:ATP-dependent RNA helicase HelY